MDTPVKVLHSEEETRAWIKYYEEGNDLPDDIMQKIFAMALLYAREAAHRNKP